MDRINHCSEVPLYFELIACYWYIQVSFSSGQSGGGSNSPDMGDEVAVAVTELATQPLKVGIEVGDVIIKGHYYYHELCVQ